jgi:hypothetical protein
MKLELYIRKNRNELDVEKPDEEYLWTGILQALNGNRKPKNVALWRYIAAASAILIVSVSAAYLFTKNSKQQLIFVNIDPVLASQEAQFKSQINSFTTLIKQASYNDSQLATGNSEVQYIDELIEHYSEDLKQNGPNSQLINSLMDLYQKKLMLLERMLNEIEKSKENGKRKINI